MTETRLRKDLMKPFTRMICERNLHPECWMLILNSPAQQPLKMKCEECRDKYIQLASPTNETSQAKKTLSQRVGLRKYLLARNIELERQNALLEKEIADLKARLKSQTDKFSGL